MDDIDAIADQIEALARAESPNEKGENQMTDNLSETLRAAGHPELADALADKQLADQLRARGHDDAASLVDGKRSAPQTDGTAAETDGSSLLEQLDRDTGLVTKMREQR